MSERQPRREPGLVDLCPICVFLLDSEEGQILFEHNIVADIHKRENIIMYVGWRCLMCGATGVGEIPQFHEKPKEKRTAAGE